MSLQEISEKDQQVIATLKKDEQAKAGTLQDAERFKHDVMTFARTSFCLGKVDRVLLL